MSLIFLLGLSVAMGDSWKFPIGTTIKPFKSGSMECVESQTVTSDKFPQYPTYEVKCNDHGKPMFTKKDFGADEIVPSDDHKYVLGLSNNGLHLFAFWIVDSEGREIRKVKHEFPEGNPEVKYCEMSISLSRVWVAKDPKARFVIEDGKLKDVTVKSCSGKTISLMSGDHAKDR